MNLRSEKKLVLATGNQKKLVELQAILQDAGVEILTLDDFPSLPEVEEDGQTMANAVKKAREFTGLPTLADDSGLKWMPWGPSGILRPGLLVSLQMTLEIMQNSESYGRGTR